MTDQHNPSAMGCAGHAIVKTPALDRLAASGTRFASAYTPCPICVPARAAMATGRYPHQLGCWDNATPYVGSEAASWGHRLTDAGHAVVTIGKLHYRDSADDTGFPDQRIPLHVHAGGPPFGLLRDRFPPWPPLREYVEAAREGDSDYLRYDRAIAIEAAAWLRDEAPTQDKPWALMVSFVSPHPPMTAPPEYMQRYSEDEVVLHPTWPVERWSRHPALEFKRRCHMMGADNPLSEEATRRALRTYYALCSFVDDQIGIVLDALGQCGLADSTRIIYTSDHGDMASQQGIWDKGTMYEGAVGVPMIVAGPDVPSGRVCTTNASLIDVFPSALSCVGLDTEPGLPGADLFALAADRDRSRTVFSEYHASGSARGIFMVRSPRYKFVHHVSERPQLYDMLDDPDETTDLGTRDDHEEIVESHRAMLSRICNPTEVDARARADQQRRLDEHGGADAVLATGPTFLHSPTPTVFRRPGEGGVHEAPLEER